MCPITCLHSIYSWNESQFRSKEKCSQLAYYIIQQNQCNAICIIFVIVTLIILQSSQLDVHKWDSIRLWDWFVCHGNWISGDIFYWDHCFNINESGVWCKYFMVILEFLIHWDDISFIIAYGVYSAILQINMVHLNDIKSISKGSCNTTIFESI